MIFNIQSTMKLKTLYVKMIKKNFISFDNTCFIDCIQLDYSWAGVGDNICENI